MNDVFLLSYHSNPQQCALFAGWKCSLEGTGHEGMTAVLSSNVSGVASKQTWRP